jgi:hypothetical protein
MKFLIPAIIVLSLSLSSCDPAEKYKTEIAEIDSCLVVLDSIETKFNGIEFDSLQMMVDHVLMNEDTIEKYYKPDTVSLEIGIRMNDSKGIRKTLKNLDQKERVFREEIDAMKAQLENLKNDVSNGVLAKEKIDEYLATEKMDLNVLNLSFNDFYTLQETQCVFYYASVPIIDEFIIKLKSEIVED